MRRLGTHGPIEPLDLLADAVGRVDVPKWRRCIEPRLLEDGTTLCPARKPLELTDELTDGEVWSGSRIRRDAFLELVETEPVGFAVVAPDGSDRRLTVD
ncbi:hypothetical protein [Halalkalicoccus salilacus]|uniref:hypothetical protein n=1 Tax=Halalkalicoccus salilacus TaxID=3117459 RepID=UPI00300E71AC